MLPVSSPLTRVLLTNDGSTTAFLSALLAEPLRVRVLVQAHRPAATALPPQLQCQLQLDSAHPVILRRSELIRPDGRTVSANKVVMVPDHPVIDAIVDGGDVPLGQILRAGGIEQRRQILQTGARRWHWGTDAGHLRSPCRSYLVTISGHPLLYIEETFHPEVIPASADLPLLHSMGGVINQEAWRSPGTRQEATKTASPTGMALCDRKDRATRELSVCLSRSVILK